MPQSLNDISMTASGAANYSFEVSSGQTVKVETGPGGQEICSGTPPPGKKWLVQISVFFAVEDA